MQRRAPAQSINVRKHIILANGSDITKRLVRASALHIQCPTLLEVFVKIRSSTLGRAPRAQALLVVASLLSVCALPHTAQAGGLYLMPRGTEAASRGGARVAGSDDPQALWYNPAGLLSSGRQLLVDALLPLVRTDFTRVLDNGNVEPRVSSTSAIPIPTIAYSDNFGLKRWGFGVGLLIPPAFGGEWPNSVNGGRPAPQRYSALSGGEGSFAATLALGAAYRPVDRLSLGVALYLTAAQVGGTVAISACDYALCSQPEAPEWEGRTRFLLGPVFTATAVLGAIYAFDYVKLGASLQLKTKIAGDASFDVALPDQAAFDDVRIENRSGGDDLTAELEAALPMVLRAGVEAQPLKPLKVELGATWENWSRDSDITVNPKNVVLRDVPGFGDMPADSVTLVRNLRDTWAVNLGGRYDLAPLVHSRRALAATAGFMYETSSVQKRDLSVGSLDTRKVLLGVGISVGVTRNVLVDITYGHIFMQNHRVTNSRVLLPAAVKPLPIDDDPTTYDAGDRPAIGNGKYVMEADFVGLGVRWQLDGWHQRGAATPAPSQLETKPAPPAAQPPLPAEPPAWPEPIITVPPQPAPPSAPAAPEVPPVSPTPATPPEPPVPAAPAAPEAAPPAPVAPPAAPAPTPAPAASAPPAQVAPPAAPARGAVAPSAEGAPVAPPAPVLPAAPTP
jgi:long-subunit fatty acid transport protein